MSLHDRYARRTPFEIAFGPPEQAAEAERRIMEEASARGVDPGDPLHFATLGSVARLAYATGSDDPDRAHEVATLAFQALHFARAGHPLYLLDTACARQLVASAPAADPDPPAPAGYLQLPRHLFWLEEGGSAPPASVDGIHWTATGRGLLYGLVVTGVMPAHGTVGVVPLPEAPLADAPAWLDARCRVDGADFSASLPGGEMDRLYAFRTAGEALKLLARFFALLQGGGAETERRTAPDDVRAPEPTTLPYVLVRATGAT